MKTLISIIFFFGVSLVMSGVIGDMVEDGTFKHGFFRLTKFLNKLWDNITALFNNSIV